MEQIPTEAEARRGDQAAYMTLRSELAQRNATPAETHATLRAFWEERRSEEADRREARKRGSGSAWAQEREATKQDKRDADALVQRLRQEGVASEQIAERMATYWDERKAAKKQRAQQREVERGVSHARRQRDYRLRKQYGITLAEFEERWESQGRRCACCGDSRPRRVVVDHSHKTGAVRGLVCSSCNAMVGFAGDDPERLEMGIRYLSGGETPEDADNTWA